MHVLPVTKWAGHERESVQVILLHKGIRWHVVEPNVTVGKMEMQESDFTASREAKTDVNVSGKQRVREDSGNKFHCSKTQNIKKKSWGGHIDTFHNGSVYPSILSVFHRHDSWETETEYTNNIHLMTTWDASKNPGNRCHCIKWIELREMWSEPQLWLYEGNWEGM